jgi:hypothetical protein
MGRADDGAAALHALGHRLSARKPLARSQTRKRRAGSVGTAALSPGKCFRNAGQALVYRSNLGFQSFNPGLGGWVEHANRDAAARTLDEAKLVALT